MARTYYCKCGDKVESGGDMTCKCGHVFGNTFKISNHINMRTTWSGTTQLEFNNTTIEESIKNMDIKH